MKLKYIVLRGAARRIFAGMWALAVVCAGISAVMGLHLFAVEFLGWGYMFACFFYAVKDDPEIKVDELLRESRKREWKEKIEQAVGGISVRGTYGIELFLSLPCRLKFNEAIYYKYIVQTDRLRIGYTKLDMVGLYESEKDIRSDHELFIESEVLLKFLHGLESRGGVTYES